MISLSLNASRRFVVREGNPAFQLCRDHQMLITTTFAKVPKVDIRTDAEDFGGVGSLGGGGGCATLVRLCPGPVAARVNEADVD